MAKDILVVDDHSETVRLIELTLRRHGYEVRGAQTGEEGIAMAEAATPDLILLDIMMPDMNGLDVCRHLRASERFRDVPIIMFTAKTRAEDKILGFEAGANDYLVKPTRPKELIQRVEAILGSNAATDEEPSEGADIEKNEKSTDRLPHSPLIVVTGSRGGAGTTTVAINLAVSLADRGCETVLVDLDAQGHVALYLGQPAKRDTGGWLRLLASKLQEQVEDYQVSYEQDLQLLLSPPTLNSSRMLSNSWLRALLASLRASNRYVVVDAGCFIRQAPVLFEGADSVLLCLRPERPAMTAAREFVHHFQEGKKVHALMLQYGPVTLPRRLIENFLGFPLLDLIALSPQQLTQAVDQGIPLVRLQGPNKSSEQFRRLVERVLTFVPAP